MILDTVNVIEITNGIAESIVSFADNPKGNQQAEQLFIKLLKEHTDEYSASEIDDFLDAGDFDDNNGYNIVLIHSSKPQIEQV